MKEIFKNKKIVIGVVVALLVVGSVGGYFIYDNNRKSEIMNKMSITFTDVKEVEYGTKDFDIKKELVKNIENADIKEISKIDTSKIGEQVLTFTLVKSDVEKIVEHKINVVDTKAPIINLETETKELIINEEYDFMTNIKEVKDEVDGAIEINKDALEINKKATHEYNKLEKDKINDETKVAEKSLKEFLIEDVEGKEEKVLYLKNCYYVDGTVDIATVGEYKITVVAVDKNGIKTTKDFTVTVKEKEVEKPVSNNSGGSSSNGGYASSGNNGGSSSGGGSSSYVGSKSDIVNTALAQVGKAYARDTAGPNSFDCSGLIWYAYSQNGWSIPRNTISGGTRLSSYEELQPGDIIYMPSQAHVMLYIGNGSVVEAKNESTGVISHYFYGIQPDWQYIRY